MDVPPMESPSLFVVEHLTSWGWAPHKDWHFRTRLLAELEHDSLPGGAVEGNYRVAEYRRVEGGGA